MFPITALTSKVYDRLQAGWERHGHQRAMGSLLTLAFLLALACIEAARRGWVPLGWRAYLPTNHFYAVHLAFTLLLLFEVISLIFSLAHSVAESVGKQLEIFSLILLRQTFKEFTGFTEPVAWAQVSHALGRMLSDTGGALLIFVLVGLFYRIQHHRRITQDAREQESFVATKKVVALLLLVAFGAIGMLDLFQAVAGGRTYNFFEAFYTLLILSDILLVLIALRYSSTYPVVFRNSGFAAATVLMRLALTAPPYVNAALGAGAALFVCGLTLAYNTFQTVLPLESESTDT